MSIKRQIDNKYKLLYSLKLILLRGYYYGLFYEITILCNR